MDVIDNEQKKGSSKNLKVHFELPHDAAKPPLPRQNSTSSSSSSSDSSLDSSVAANPPLELKQDGLEFQESSSSEISPPISQWSMQSASPSQSPNIFRPSGYDPARIPSSIFSKPSTAMEWSVASNESLFSIHVGNNSFSRDHLILLHKSGELNRPVDEFMNINPPTPPPPIAEVKPVESQNLNVEKDLEATEKPVEISEATNTSFKDSQEQNSNDKASPPADAVQHFVSVSCRSDESARSFQFPVLAGDAGRNSSAKVDLEKQSQEKQSQETELKEVQEQEQPLRRSSTQKAAPTGWSNWMCCCWGSQGKVSDP
ncbi:uncharacterized protein LOC107415877 [Ziziphus jujuba]|uniref:Uncharacterized protein LOC107415877 n=1 Tax=Ziziphus jujuba TaxID=326968 RepID=A0A6P6G4L0_ZIZJJ|nr:uncharacterized protein LOC107415877 [Ziziphus jujuba]